MPTTRRRTVTKLLRLHPDELAQITTRAEACGLKPARFIRETALGAMPKARHHADTDRLLRSLARIGRTLERATRLTRRSPGSTLAEHLVAALEEQHALVKQVTQDGRQGPRRPPR